tara:strand:- start:205 stop:375 length:171 start_codon:yes stop_codon:yes gene_type:complete
MNFIEDLEQDLQMLYSLYRKHPESAEAIAEQIERLEEYLEMCYDPKNVYKHIQEVA